MTQATKLTAELRQARLKAVFERVIARNGDAIRKLAQDEREEHQSRLRRNSAYIKRVHGEGLRRLAQS